MIDGIKLLLKDAPFEIVGEVSSPQSLVTEVHRLQPDLLLLDLNMAGQNMVDVIAELKQVSSRLKILIFSSYNTRSLVKGAFLEGADGYVLKDTTRTELITALDAVLANETYVGKSVHYALSNSNEQAGQRLRDAFSQLADLSEREIEIIQQIIRGKTSQEIATELFISIHTVQTHRKNILRKLNLHGGSDIIRFAYEMGLNQQ